MSQENRQKYRKQSEYGQYGQYREESLPRAWAAVGVLAGGLFLAVLSTTVVSVALPAIGRDLSADATALEWTVDAYVLVYASLLVAGGVLGDRHGRKGLFLLGVTIFGIGSLVTGLAGSVAVLLAGRVVQGLGPALLVPGSLTIIRAVLADERRRAAAIGLWSMSSGLALAVGPALGGAIVDEAGWRWVFLLNVPLSAGLVLLAARYVPRLPRNPSPGRFDHLGAALTMAVVAAISFGLIDGQDRGWASPAALAAFAGGAGALAWFAHRERRIADPLVDVTLFKRAAFTAANLAALVVFFSFVGAIVYFSAYFQQVLGRSPVGAGLAVSAIGIAFAVAAPLSGQLVGRVGTRPPMLAGLVMSGVAMLGLLRLGPATGVGAIWWNLALVGGGVGLCLTPMTAIAVSAVDASRAGMASAVHNAMRQLGQVLGVAVLGALVYAHPAVRDATGRLGPHDRALFVAGLHHALWVAGLALLVAAAITAILDSGDDAVHEAHEAHRRVFTAVAPGSTGGRSLNFIYGDSATPDQVRAAYEPAGYRRLTALKAVYDPDNMFRLNHNIPPTRHGAGESRRASRPPWNIN